MTTFTKHKVEKIIDDYLSGTKHSVSVTMIGRTADIDIMYTDFKQQKQVRRDIEDMIPNAGEIHINRIYSDEAYADAANCLVSNDETVYIKNDEGEYVATTIMMMTEEILSHQDLNT